MSWIKKTFGLVAIVGGAGAFACSGTNQVVGRDGLTVDSGSAGGPSAAAQGGKAGQSVVAGTSVAGDPSLAPELHYEQMMILAGATHSDGRPLCLPIELPLDPATGNAACFVLSTEHNTDCNCAGAGYSPVSKELSQMTRQQMQMSGICDAEGFAPCEEVCVCRVDPAVGKSLHQCQSEAVPDANATGWCYVSEAGDAAQQALVADCPAVQRRRMRFLAPVTEYDVDAPDARPDMSFFLGCSFPRPVAALGEVCISDDEYKPTFLGYSARNVIIEDHAAMCESGICVKDHFQGRASCPYGQADGSGDCLVAGDVAHVTGPVAPQLQARQANVASICSCQCEGPGPGPYCTCPDNMQCEHLVDDLGFGSPLVGSYCLPRGTQYDPQQDTALCSGSNCGARHYFH